MRTSVLALLSAFVLACSTPPQRVCTPGASVACTCSSGAAGAQVCNTDGTALGGCVCASGMDGGDAADAGDASGDAAPGDGGPHDLSVFYDAAHLSLITTQVDAGCSDASCMRVRTEYGGPGNCQWRNDSLGSYVFFNLGGSSTDSFQGEIDLAGAFQQMMYMSSAGVYTLTLSQVERGTPYPRGSGMAVNIHVEFSFQTSASHVGFTGVPGMTVSPSAGDVWLMGCPAN